MTGKVDGTIERLTEFENNIYPEISEKKYRVNEETKIRDQTCYQLRLCFFRPKNPEAERTALVESEPNEVCATNIHPRPTRTPGHGREIRQARDGH